MQVRIASLRGGIETRPFATFGGPHKKARAKQYTAEAFLHLYEFSKEPTAN